MDVKELKNKGWYDIHYNQENKLTGSNNLVGYNLNIEDFDIYFPDLITICDFRRVFKIPENVEITQEHVDELRMRVLGSICICNWVEKIDSNDFNLTLKSEGLYKLRARIERWSNYFDLVTSFAGYYIKVYSVSGEGFIYKNVNTSRSSKVEELYFRSLVHRYFVDKILNPYNAKMKELFGVNLYFINKSNRNDSHYNSINAKGIIFDDIYLDGFVLEGRVIADAIDKQYHTSGMKNFIHVLQYRPVRLK